MTPSMLTRPAGRRISVLAEWTNSCNLTCSLCPISKPDMRPRGHMSLELWDAILDSCVREGHFVEWAHFFGEPLLWKHFFEGMERWRASGISRLGRISTNGLLLSDDKIDCIAESGVAYLRVCLDSTRPEVYRRLRGSQAHDQVVAAVARVLGRAPELHCQVQILRSSENPDEGPSHVFRLFGRRRNLSVFVSDCQHIGGDSTLSFHRNPAPDPRTCAKVDYEHCPITWDGRIGLCCMDYPLLNRLGDLSEGSIGAVYLGERAEGVRRAIRAGDYRLAPYCSRCPMDHVGCSYQQVFADRLRPVRRVWQFVRRSPRQIAARIVGAVQRIARIAGRKGG